MGSRQLKVGRQKGGAAPLIRDLARASRLLQSRLQGEGQPRFEFRGVAFGHPSPIRVMDAVWMIQACLDVAETSSDPNVPALREQAHQHLMALTARGPSSSATAWWRGLGWGPLLSSTVPVRYESAACGELFLRVAGQVEAGWPLDAAKSIHVFLSSNAGRLFEEGDQFCLSNSLDVEAEHVSLAASAMSAAFSARLFHQLDFDGGDVGFAQRLMRGVVNRQRDQGNWPLHWRGDGGQGEQSLVDHACMLQSLADYMAVRDRDFELNYRYGLQWLLAALPECGRKGFGPEERAASVLALTRAQQYWARETMDADLTLAAACGQKADEVAAGFRRPLWRRPKSFQSMVWAAEAQRERYKMWAAEPGR